MANWDRNYLTVTYYDDPYLVEVKRPAGWRPKNPLVPGTTWYRADIIGTIPGEAYELPYEKKTGSPAATDTWKLGPTFKMDSERSSSLKVKDKTTATAADLATDRDRPKLRDGADGGVEESGGEFKTPLEIYIGKKRYFGELKVTSGKVKFVRGFIDPSPEKEKKKKREMKVIKKKGGGSAKKGRK